MTVPADAPAANDPGDTPKPLTAARMHYEGAVAAGTHTAEQLERLKRFADEADANIEMTAGPAAIVVQLPPPATEAEWQRYIPEHMTFAPTTSEGSACACPANGALALHVTGCQQGVAGMAQPYGETFAKEHGLAHNMPVTATTLGAALRGISEAGLPAAMALEADDRDLDAEVRRARGPELDAKLRELSQLDAAELEARREEANAEYQQGFAQGLATGDELGPLLDALSARITADEYHRLLDGVDLSNTAGVRAHLEARLKAADADTSTRPAFPGEVAELRDMEQEVATMRAAGHGGLADELESLLAAMRGWPKYRVRVTEPTAKRKSDWRVEAAPLEKKLFSMLPCTRHVAATADALGVGRQGVLAVTLTRTSVAVGPHVRLLTASGMRGTVRQGGSLNFYSALVGKPNAGKTEAADAGAYLVPLSDDDLIPEGTGEGIVKSFGFMRREKHGKGEDAFYTYEFEKLAERILMAADEVDAVFAEMVRQGTKFASMWRSMWMGAMVGTTTGNVELRTRLLPHTYRLGALLGCQPEATVALWEEGNRGTPQRIYWAPCTRRKPDGKEVPGPLALAYQPEPTPVGLPEGYRPAAAVEPGITNSTTAPAEPEPQWINWPPAARAFIEAELEALQEDDDPYGEGDDDEEDEVLKLLGHSTFMRLKIMALLAIMDGLEQPTNRHWEAAGIAMQLREMCIRRTKARATRAGKVAAENKGDEQGLTRATAKLAEEAAAAEFAADLEVRIITVMGQLVAKHQTVTEAAIARRCSKKQQAHVPKRLDRMCSKGLLSVDPTGVYSVIRVAD